MSEIDRARARRAWSTRTTRLALHTDTTARRIAVLIAVLAAALALAEMGEKGAQNDYLTHHIAASDDWAFYQAKNVRATVLAAEAGILANLPNAAEAGPQAEIKRAKETEARLRDEPQGDGMKQLLERAKDTEAARDERSIATTNSNWWSGHCRSPSCWRRSPW